MKQTLLPPAAAAGPHAFIWPVAGNVVSRFGEIAYGAKNKGIDIECPPGARVAASRSGKVIFSGDQVRGMGKVIIMDHLDGFTTVYGGNSKNLVKAGDCIAQGDAVAEAGSTGRNTQTRVHFEIRKGRRPQDPLEYLN